MSVIAEWLTRICPELNQALHESNHLRRIATALACESNIEQTLNLVVEECMRALAADASCLYLLNGFGKFQMHAERNCSGSLKADWMEIPERKFHVSNYDFFLGSRSEFSKLYPGLFAAFQCVDFRSFAFAPLVVNKKMTGFMGFFFNNLSARVHSIRPYAMTVLQFCTQAVERVRLTENEQLARQKAESASRAKSEFLANISHEIRAPIGVVQGFTDLLIESEGLNANQKHWISVIRRNTQQLTALIGEVLDISKIEAEKIEVKRCEFCLHELLEDVRTSAHFKAKDKNIELLFLSENLPDFVNSDPVRLRQILVNLVGNAIKFTEKGSVRVHVTYDRLSSALRISVSDTGVGIPEDLHEQIFEPFRQTAVGALHQFGGTGLGLTISKRLALALGGDVLLQNSRPGEGSTFLFVVPCDVVQVHLSHSDSVPYIHEARASLRGMKILIVEDSPDSQDLLRNLLCKEGAQVDVAETGIAGVKMAMSRNYDVVLMDIQMPGLSGHEAVTWLRSHGYDRPVAALTAHALSGDKQSALIEGFDEYLTKPIERRVLIDCLQRLAHVEGRVPEIRH